MARKKAEQEESETMTEVTEKHTRPKINDISDLMDFEITCLADFEIYNKAARRLGRPVKVPDETYHEKMTVKFQRFDQPDNVLKARVRNKDIDWTGQLKPGCKYDLPIPVVMHLNSLAVPIYAEVKTVEGGETITETKQVGEKQRFSLNPVF